jgi:hypothetical protein
MFIRYLHLALLAAAAATAVSQSAPESTDVNMARQLATDFNWDIQPEDGFPIIGFDNTTEKNEVIFKYNFTGTLTERKFLDVTLYQSDCISASDASLAFVNSTNGDELDIDVDIIQETISDSVHYREINKGTANVGFCLRVDYNYIDNDGIIEGINFFETNVTIDVDLTANFTLTGININRDIVENENATAEFDYPVEAYFCLDDNSEVENPKPLTQGSTLQVCVKIDESVVIENILIEDILTFVISQPTGTAINSESITDGLPDVLTDKVCRESGICNVKTQLQSKFFTETVPGDLRVDGVAILAFGKASLMPSSAPTVASATRRLRAPIRGLFTSDDVKTFISAQQNTDESGISVISVVADSSQRILQEGIAESDFGLEVGLEGIRSDVSGQGILFVGNISDSNSEGDSDENEEEGDPIDKDTVIVVVGTIISALACYLFFCLCAKRRRREEKEEVTNYFIGNTLLSRRVVFVHV